MAKTPEEYEEIIRHLEYELSNKKYGLVWDREHTKEDVVLKCEKYIPILNNVSDMNVLHGRNNNIIIEGDNYHSLLSLCYVLSGTVDFIYIDPPYNTGNKAKDGGFKYNDVFIDRENAYRHSKWLSMMKKRLELARKLLSEYGVIFISIDDNELFNLKLLCDQIFNESNFLGNIVQNKGNAQNDAKNLQKNHDYILVYAKKRKFEYTSDGKQKEVALISAPAEDEKEVFIDEEGKYFYLGSGLLTGSAPTLRERINLGYTIYYNPQTKDKIAVHDYDEEKAMESDDEDYVYTDVQELLDRGYVKIRPPKKSGKLGRWTWSLEKFNSESYKIIITDKLSVRTKVFIEPSQAIKKGKKLIYLKKYRTNNLKSFYDFSSSAGTESLQKILPGNEFNNPKNLEMMKFLINSYDKKDALILDFFAGSGTTGQAVLELNKEDGGERRFILCTNNENNICLDSTYPRNKTVITGIRPDGSVYDEGMDANLYYFRTDFIADEANSEQAKYNLVEKIDSLLCICENVFKQCERNDYSSHYHENNKHLFIYNDFYNEIKFQEFKQRVLSAEGDIVVYIYSSDNNLDQNLIVGNNIELKAIPSKIYEIYKEVVEGIKRGE